MADRYRIFRYYIRGDRREILKEGLDWNHVREHLADDDTKFDTARSEHAMEITKNNGPWWDCWEHMDDEDG